MNLYRIEERRIQELAYQEQQIMRLNDEKDQGIPMLDGTNYGPWSAAIRFKLMSKGFWGTVVDAPLEFKVIRSDGEGGDEEEDDGEASGVEAETIVETEESQSYRARVTDKVREMDQKALGIIGMNVAPGLSEQIVACKTAADAWKTLKSLYENDHAGTTWAYLQEFMDSKMDGDSDILAFLGNLERLQRLTVGSKCPISNEQLILKVVLGLPNSWDSFTQGLRSDKDLFESYASLKQRVIAEFKIRGNRGKTKGTDQEKKKSAFKAEVNGSKFKGECRNCGKQGHKRADCWAKGGGKEGRGPKQGSANQTEKKKDKEEIDQTKSVFMAERRIASGRRADARNSVSERQNRVSWIFGSGTTDHMIARRDHLQEIVWTNTRIKIADKREITGKAVGTITYNDDQGNEIKLTNVWYVPDLGRNLLSVAAIDKAGYTTEFKDGRARVINTSGELLIEGKLDHSGLYQVQFLKGEKRALLARSKKEPNLWHKRMGHAHETALNALSGVDEIVEPCDACHLGKGHRLPWDNDRGRTKVALSTIHVDLCGPMETAGIKGEKYFLAITDEATDFTEAYTFTGKDSEVIVDAIMEFIARMENQLDKRVKRIKADGGGEFINDQLIEFTKTKGIILDQTNPYTPQQNGTAERKNRTLVETARCLLAQACLPKRFWAEALTTSAYLRNRVPNRSDLKTPYERMHGRAPDLKYIRIFGSQCFRAIPKDIRKKWDRTTEMCILLGYTTNGYKLYETNTGKIAYSRDVKFNERSLGVPRKGRS